MNPTHADNLSLRRARKLRCTLAALLVGVLSASGTAQEESAAPWQQFLQDAGVAIDDLQAFKSWRREGRTPVLTDQQGTLAAKLMYRLDRALNLQDIAAPTMQPNEPADLGRLVSIVGRVRTITRVELPATSSAALEQDAVFHCLVALPDGAAIGVLSRRAPLAWLKNQPRVLDESVSFTAMRVGEYAIAGSGGPLFIASRFEWRPEKNISAGVAWLVERGFDAALLDEIRHGRAFAKPHESLEGLAFYRSLAILARSRPEELVQLVRGALAAKAEEAEANLADAAAKRESLTAKWSAAGAAERNQLRKQLASARRRQAIASGIVERAERGTSSVAPLFLEPQQHTGEAVLIEGTARRAIRIVLDEDVARAAQPPAAEASQGQRLPPLTEYYELDVFTTDSQNLPVICCVARLPERFPTGEAIREPVRVAGIFFKQWAYVRRADNEGVSTKNRPPERLHPPLIIASAPQWLRTTEPPAPANRGLWGGLAFLAVFLAVVVALVRVARRDRLAQDRPARYDSSLENIAEP